MTRVPRQAIYDALYALIPTVAWTNPDGTPGAFATVSKRVQLFNQIDATSRPSCMQAEHDESVAQVSNLPYKRTFAAHWIIYTNADLDADLAPSEQINTILEAIETAVAPTVYDPGYPSRNTLGGLVHHCYISGEIFKDPGDIDGTGLLMVPFKILAP